MLAQIMQWFQLFPINVMQRQHLCLLMKLLLITFPRIFLYTDRRL